MLNYELDEETLQKEYQEYLLKCDEDGIIKPRSIHQFKWMGVMVFPKVKSNNRPIEPKAETKADIARRIFAEELEKGLVRKTVVARFIAEAGLTQAGAGTYYANYMIKMKKQQDEANG